MDANNSSPGAANEGGAAILDQMVEEIRRHITLGPYYTEVTAFWILHAYSINAYRFSPRLHVFSPEKLLGGRRGNGNFVAACNRWSAAMPQPNDLSRSLVALDQNSTIIGVIEMNQSIWLVAGVLPGIERQPRKSWSRMPKGCLACCIAGAMRRSGPVKRSRGLRLPLKPAATASGWRAGSRRAGSRRT